MWFELANCNQPGDNLLAMWSIDPAENHGTSAQQAHGRGLGSHSRQLFVNNPKILAQL